MTHRSYQAHIPHFLVQGKFGGKEELWGSCLH